MWGWLGRIGEVVKDWWDRLTGRARDDDDDEDDDDEEDEEDEEAEEGEDEEAEEGEDEEAEEGDEAEEGGVERGEDDDYTTLMDLVRGIEDDIDENAAYLTNAELARTDELLEQLYELLAEYETLDADDRSALIDLALEVLDELERLVLAASLRADDDDSCSERRGPFSTYEEARRYADDIPLPTWVYQDGLGWWWVCIEESTPASVEA
jgi:hypothetical protein